MEDIELGPYIIGKSSPVFIIAELSANHRGSIKVAKETILAAAEAGANAIKLQTYTPDAITLKSSETPFQVRQNTLWDGRTLHDLYSEGYLPWEWHPELFSFAHSLGLAAFSSPFDPAAVDFLDSLDVPAYKVASFEITDVPLIRYIASKSKPVLISTGIARLEDVARAVEACRAVGNREVCLMKCTSLYPAPAGELNLRVIPRLEKEFSCLVGYSDHTTGTSAALAAVALGAKVVERHITIEGVGESLDSGFSTSPDDFANMVRGVREVEESLGTSKMELSPRILESRHFARSLFVVRDVRAGDLVSLENVRSIRPGIGMEPRFLASILGGTFASAVVAGTPMSEDLLSQPADLGGTH